MAYKMTYTKAADILEQHKDWGWNGLTTKAIDMAIELLRKEAKIDNYIAGREDGLQLALNIVKKKGVKGLEDEIRFRNATKIHTLLDKKVWRLQPRR